MENGKRLGQGLGRDITPLSFHFQSQGRGQLIATRLFVNTLKRELRRDEYFDRHWFRVRELEKLFFIVMEKNDIRARISREMIRRWLRSGYFGEKGVWKMRRSVKAGEEGLWLVAPVAIKSFLNRLLKASEEREWIRNVK